MALIAILIFGASSTLSHAAGDHGVVIQNVTLNSPDRSAPMFHADVVLQNGKIAKVGTKLTFDPRSNLILGASILGVGADEAIHSIIDIMAARVPYTTLQNTVHIHPTVSELIPTVLGELGPPAGMPV